MKFLFLAALGFSVFAEAGSTEFSPIVRCVNYDSAYMTVVNIERRVVDIYTPKARFEDRLTSTTGMVDPGVSVPWVSGLVQTEYDGHAHIYRGEDFNLKLELDFSTRRATNGNGGTITNGKGTMSNFNSIGRSESFEMNCDYYDQD